MSQTGWDYIFVLSILVIAGAVLSIMLWQIIRAVRLNQEARFKFQQEANYRELAERATVAQESTTRQRKELHEHMADLRIRVTDMERMMREVE